MDRCERKFTESLHATEKFGWKKLEGYEYTVRTKYISAGSHYQFRDKENTPGLSLYRLKQTDMKKMLTYSKTIVTGQKETGTNIRFSHNTILRSAIDLDIVNAMEDKFEITVYNISGHRVKHLQQAVHSGDNHLKIDLPSALPSGVYLLAVNNNKGRHLYSSKLIKD